MPEGGGGDGARFLFTAPPPQIVATAGDRRRSGRQQEQQEGEENKGMALMRRLRATGQQGNFRELVKSVEDFEETLKVQ